MGVDIRRGCFWAEFVKLWRSGFQATGFLWERQWLFRFKPLQSEYQRHDQTDGGNTSKNHFDDSKLSGKGYVLRRGEHFESEPRVEVCEKLRIAKHQESPSAYPEESHDIEDDVNAF
jgi:hypothetical protein